MRILHTADLHLSKDRPRTIEALQEIMSTAKQHAADLVTIGGDMFDTNEDAVVLRTGLREIFDSCGIEVLVIAGNHDKRAFAPRLHFGSKVRVAKEPFTRIKKRGIEIVAVPFTDKPTSELLGQLRRKSSRKTGILLLHCTLDIGFFKWDFGEEESPVYFPITASTLSKLNYDFILAGHFHKEVVMEPLDNGGTFVYPGSPISHTVKELGKRHVVLLDTSNKQFERIPLPTFYYDQKQVDFRPGKEEQLLRELKEWVKTKTGQNCTLLVVAGGFINYDEQKLARKLDKLGKNVEVTHRYQDVRRILEHPLYKRFKRKLASQPDIEEKDLVERRVIEAMARILSSRS